MKDVLLAIFLLPGLAFASRTAPQEAQGILLVTAPELAQAWQPFAAWKASIGKPTTIVTTQTIASDFPGVDIQDKIRNCVRHHIDTQSVRWVILGGDSLPNGGGLVPDRDTVQHSMAGRETDIPTDIYYLSPTSWDADGDGIYGEFTDDRDAISYPDGSTGLGRIPVRTAQDVAAYTAKVIAYETRSPTPAYSQTVTYTCTVPGAYPKVKRSWDDHVSQALKGGTVHRYFANTTPWDDQKPGDYDLTPKNWVDMINRSEGGKYHFHGHGLLHGWVLENRTMFTAKNVKQLTNKGNYPVITTVSCFTGHYDAAKDPSISESMLRQAEAGAIAIVAPCREGKPHFTNPREDFRLMVQEGKLDGTTLTMTRFWEWGIQHELTTGEALMRAKASMAKTARRSETFHMCLAELNLLGDPTLLVHHQRPEKPATK